MIQVHEIRQAAPQAMLDAGALTVSRQEPTRRSSNLATYYLPV